MAIAIVETLNNYTPRLSAWDRIFTLGCMGIVNGVYLILKLLIGPYLLYVGLTQTCNLRPSVQYWAIVMGTLLVIDILYSLSIIVGHCISTDGCQGLFSDEHTSMKYNEGGYRACAQLVDAVMLIIGALVVYPIYGEMQLPGVLCSQHLYQFVFWLITIYLVIWLAQCIVLPILACCAACECCGCCPIGEGKVVDDGQDGGEGGYGQEEGLQMEERVDTYRTRHECVRETSFV